MQNEKLQEFYSIIQPALEEEDFLKLKEMGHHGITRFEHSMRVAKYTYYITKLCHMNYEKATFGAILHDFFTTEVKKKNVLFKLLLHPGIALENSRKYFDLSDIEEDVILSHMFPISFHPPKYLESWIVDIVDDVVAIYEWLFSLRREIVTVSTILIQFIQMR